MSYFVEDLLNSIKLRSFAPISQSTLEDDDIIALAQEEMSLKLVSDLISVREEFFETTEDQSILINKSHYPVPSRAIGNALKALYYVDSNGNQYELVFIDSSRRNEFETSATNPRAFMIEGDEVVLLPKPSQTLGTLRFLFPARPSNLIATTSCAKITGKTTVSSTVEFDVDTDLTASLSTSSYVDIQCSKSPFKLWTYRALIQAITATKITLRLADVLDQSGSVVEPEVGDYICPTGFSNIPQLPVEFHPVLSQMVNVRLMGSLGDLNKKAVEEGELERLRANALKLVKNRVEASPKKMNKRHTLIKYMR
jgi:molybdopterin converting factor small subunit